MAGEEVEAEVVTLGEIMVGTEAEDEACIAATRTGFGVLLQPGRLV